MGNRHSLLGLVLGASSRANGQASPAIGHRTWLNVVLLCVAVSACGANASSSESALELPTQPGLTSVVISAVELQFEDPSPGGQSVWLANRGANEQDISCWAISASSSGVTMRVERGTRLGPGRALRFSTPAQMLRSPDMVTLADASGRIVVRTPELTDSASDDQLWYLPPGESWRFGRARLPETASDGRLVPTCN